MARPYLAPSLVRLRREIDGRWPNRSKASDGWLGDYAHSVRKSEHNPDGKGAVHAIDITTADINARLVLRELIGDPRVWYVIHKGVIYSRTYGWRPRRYTGANPHNSHIHVSIQLTRGAENTVTPWLEVDDDPTPAPRVPAKAGQAPGARQLRFGHKGPDVAWVQRFIGRKKAGRADGVYGRKTAAAVRWYQRMRGLEVTGQVDWPTWRAMGKPRPKDD